MRTPKMPLARRLAGQAVILILAASIIGPGAPRAPGNPPSSGLASLPGSNPYGSPAPVPTPSPAGSVSPSATPSAAVSRTAAAPLVAGLAAAPLNAWSMELRITSPAGVSRLQIVRDGRLLDDVPISAGSVAYRDYLLWPSSAYTYEVRWLSPSGAVISDQRTLRWTPAAAGPFARLYAAGSFWNRPIPAGAAIDPSSDAMVARALVPYLPSANFANSAAWGRPLAYANALSRNYVVGCSMYGCEAPVSFRIPAYARPNTGSDHHLVVIDGSSGAELDMWLGQGSGGSWSAGSRYTTSASGWGAICAQGQHCGGADAAGFALMGGAVRPEEIAQGHIDHALVFTTPYTRSDVIACPATNTDGQVNDPAALPEGARIQLDPAFDVDRQPWPRWEKVVAHALQVYGAYLGDTGGSLAVFGETSLDRGYDAWSRAGVPITPSLASLPWNQFRVLAIQAC